MKHVKRVKGRSRIESRNMIVKGAFETVKFDSQSIYFNDTNKQLLVTLKLYF